MISHATSKPLPLLRDFSDRLSPMVVKELRHGLRTRFFTGALVAFHVLLILLMGVAMLGVSREVINGCFWGLAAFALLVALPSPAARSLNAEMEGGAFDMLALTSMPSFRIVCGKWAAFFSQSLLAASSLLPYMIARYQFGGVEIVRELMAMALLVLGSAVVIAALVMISSQCSVMLRFVLGLPLGIGIVPLGMFIGVFAGTNEGDSMSRAFFSLQLWEQLALALGIIAIAAYAAYFFIAMGASRIAPPSENHSTRKRVVALAVMSALMGAGICLSFGPSPQTAFMTMIPAVILAVLIGMDVMTEPMPQYPTVVMPFVKRGPAGRIYGALLYPGWASGVMFYALIAVMPFVILGFIAAHSSAVDLDEDEMGWFVCFLTLAAVPVCLPFNRANRFTNWCVVQIALVAAGVLLLIFGGATGSHSIGYVGVITPITALFGSAIHYSHASEIAATGATFGVVWLGCALALAIREMAVYRDLEAEAVELDLREKRGQTHAAV